MLKKYFICYLKVVLKSSSNKKMCLFFRSCCLNCNSMGKYVEDCQKKKNCRKKLFEIEPGYVYFENCNKCSKKLKKEFKNIPYCYSMY